MSVKIIQFQAMKNDQCWQASILGLGDDGVMYISHGGKDAKWDVYQPLEFNQDQVTHNKTIER